MEGAKKKNVYLLILKLLVSACIVFFVLKKINVSKTILYLSEASFGWLAVAIFSFVVSKIISAYRLNQFYKVKELLLSDKLNVKLYLLAMYYSLFIPGIGGDGFKVYWLNKNYKFQFKHSVWISLLDRASGLVALLSLMVCFFVLSKFELPNKAITLFVIPVVYLSFYLTLKLFFKSYVKVFGLTSLQSLVVQILQVACTWCILLALGVNNSVNEYIFIFLVSCLAFVIPVFGVREAAFVLGAKWFGLDSELTAAVSVLFYGCLAFTSLCGMYYFFLPEKLNLNEGSYTVTSTE